MNYTINELRKYGVKLEDKDIENGLIQLGHEVEETINMYTKGIVIGEVIECVKHPNSDKLSITKVNIGSEILQIVCGAPNVRVGLKVLTATNGVYIKELDLKIKEIKILDVSSNGMLCSLSELGLSKSVLNEKDTNGICELPIDSPIGADGCQYLGLDDKILDVSLTADRGDCQNYAGVVNDLKTLSNNQGSDDTYTFTSDILDCVKANYQTEQSQNITIEATKTKYYSTQLIKDVNVCESKLKEQIFLMKHGIKPQNSLVDNSNYGLLTYGIPTHVFDYDKITGQISVKYTSEGEKFIALDGNEYSLDAGTLVVCDELKIIAIAGVIGSFETKVTSETKNILFELAIFDPTDVRLAAKQIGFKTEASIRYEKGVNYDAINKVRNELVANFGGTAMNPQIAIATTPKNKQITLNFDTIKRVLGIEIKRELAKSILNDLKFIAADENEHQITYTVPTHRHDVDFENDLVEEIIRVYGIDKIEISDHLPSFNKTKKIHNNFKLLVERKIEDGFLSNGLSQVVTYSLTSEQKISKFNARNEAPVKLAYPLSNERALYRQSLVQSLIECAKYNFDRQMTSSTIFEIANTYYIEQDEIKERRLVAGLVSGIHEEEYLGVKRNFDFYDLKAIVEASLKEVNVAISLTAHDFQYDELNKYASAKISCGDVNLGYIATIHPNYVKKAKYPIHIFELDLDILCTLATLKPTYKQVTNAPSVERDYTITTNRSVTYDQVLKVLDGVLYISDVKLMDLYSGAHIASDKHAYTIKLKFEINGQTLTSEMIDAQANKIIDNIKLNNYQIQE